MAQHVDLPLHFIAGVLKIVNKVNRFAQYLPFARLHSSVCWEVLAQLVEQLLHLLSPLPLGELVGYPQLRGARVGRGSVL